MSTPPKVTEHAIAFPCADDTLIGVISTGPKSLSTGVVIIVGGPQYRAGSHRQFVSLARTLAEAGYATLRFDYRGMGDSSGEPRTFEGIDDDIRAAVDALCREHPRMESVVLWGLCDAASAAMMYAPKDGRIAGLVVANPWARGEESYARTQLKHYYTRRLLSADFWRKVASGNFNPWQSASEFGGNVAKAASSEAGRADYRERMLAGLGSFGGPVLLLISGQDLTAREFLDFKNSSPLGELFQRPNVTSVSLPESDHTFSQRAWKQRVEGLTRDWLDALAHGSRAKDG